MSREFAETRESLDLNAFDLGLVEVEKLAASPELGRQSFYKTCVQKVAHFTGANAAIALSKSPGGQISVLAEKGWAHLPESARAEIHKQLVADFDQCPEASDYLIAAQKIVLASKIQIQFLIIRKGKRASFEQEVFNDFCKEVVKSIGSFERKQADRNPKNEGLAQVAQLVQNIGKSSTRAQTLKNLVNDLAKVTSSDRVSFISPTGKVEAVSGSAIISDKSGHARVLSKLARLIGYKQGIFEWQPDSQSELQRNSKKAAALVSETFGSYGFVIPVLEKTNGRFYGWLVIEYKNEISDFVLQRQLVHNSIEFSTPVLAQHLNWFSIPFINTLDFCFNRVVTKPIRSFALLLTMGGLLALLGFWLFIPPQKFEIATEGTLQAKHVRNVFSPVEGKVESILVEEGDMVAESQQILRMKSDDNEEELESILGKIAELNQQLRTLELSQPPEGRDLSDFRTEIAGKIELVRITIKGLKTQQQFLEADRKKLNINSPIRGIVTTKNIQERLGSRPVNRGNHLLSIADIEGPWELQLSVPEESLGYIRAAQESSGEPLEVRFRAAADSNLTFVGKLKEIDFRATEKLESTNVEVTVEIDEEELGDSLRLGSRVYARVDCGEESRFYILTYQLRDKLRKWFFY